MTRIRRGPMQADRFTQVSNAVARDSSLSRRARGLFLELSSHVDGWRTSVQQLVKLGPEGKDAVRAALHELEQAELLVRIRERHPDGKLGDMEFVITDQPGALAHLRAEDAQAAEQHKPSSAPVAENPPQGLSSDDGAAASTASAPSRGNTPHTDDHANPVADFPTLAEPTLAQPPPKNTNPEEHQDEEDQHPARRAAVDTVTAREAEAAPSQARTPGTGSSHLNQGSGWTPARNEQVDTIVADGYGATDPDDGGVDPDALADEAGKFAVVREHLRRLLEAGDTPDTLIHRITARAQVGTGPAREPLARARWLASPPRHEADPAG